MKFIQKILSHGLLIAFFAAVVFLYLYRVDLFPQWFAEGGRTVTAPVVSSPEKQPIAAIPADVSAPAKDIEQDDSATETSAAEPESAIDLPPMADQAKPAATATDLPPLDTAPPVDTEAVDVTGTATSEHPPAESVTSTQQASTSPAQYRPLEPAAETSEPGDAVAEDAAGPEVSEQTPAGQSAPMQQDADVSVAAAVQQFRPLEQPKTPPELPAALEPQQTAPAAGTVSSTSDYEAQLAAARQFFWRRDVRGALQSYRSLTESYPEQADAWGELGNLYFNLGRRPAAAEAYYHAIDLLIKQGEARRAHHMLRVMYGLDTGKAGELEKRLRQVGS